tara:strand:- start:1056 stop:2078 length:1023 start_codon:yes stop_codon:yes gene_type:complete
MPPEQITASSKYSVKRLMMIAAKLAVTGVLIWYLLSKVDLAKSGEHLASFDVGWGLLAVLALALIFLIASVRWRIYARALKIPLGKGIAFRIYLISQFLGQVLPAGIGNDAVRVWLLARHGNAVGPSASSVVLERLTGLIGNIVLIAALLPLTFTYIDDTSIRLVVILVVAICAAGIFALFGISFLPHLMTKWRSVAMISRLADIASEARRASFMLKPAATAFLLSLSMHLTAVLAAYLIALGLDLELSAEACLALMPIVLLLGTLPISLAGWGVREGAAVTALSYAGVASSEALTLSILFGLSLLTVSLFGAIFWLFQRRSTVLTRVNEKKSGNEAALQ